MSLSNWLLGSCGKSHIGIYSCSKCGWELFRSGLKDVIKKSVISSLIPVPTAEGTHKKKYTSITAFTDSMMEDFTKSANNRGTFHKNSMTRTIMGTESEDGQAKYEIACGKCGNIFGLENFHNGYSTFNIKVDSIDLTFRAA
ncbi:Methionine-R-sulfoxide reductase B1-A [Orchesella cincta]|uniref:Methionine-R-sulfoxide reductase B1-A n=1 Tax=Orchesella cincta TaxID=48709 RepID=A0A1D2N851_ORCCI|nr:Methionine-R-sulfoxide reductase B1-A [Orchesella cincta]